MTIYHCLEECFNFWADISLSETIFSNCKESPRQTLFKHFLTYFQNIVLVEPGFEGSKFHGHLGSNQMLKNNGFLNQKN